MNNSNCLKSPFEASDRGGVSTISILVFPILVYHFEMLRSYFVVACVP
jgi:hypothetical protein